MGNCATKEPVCATTQVLISCEVSSGRFIRISVELRLCFLGRRSSNQPETGVPLVDTFCLLRIELVLP